MELQDLIDAEFAAVQPREQQERDRRNYLFDGLFEKEGAPD